MYNVTVTNIFRSYIKNNNWNLNHLDQTQYMRKIHNPNHAIFEKVASVVIKVRK